MVALQKRREGLFLRLSLMADHAIQIVIKLVGHSRRIGRRPQFGRRS